MNIQIYFIEIKCWLVLIIFSFILISLTTYLYKDIFLFLISTVLTQTNGTYLNYFIFTGVAEILEVHYSLTKFIWLQIFNVYLFYNCFGFFALSLYKKEYFVIKLIFQKLLIACCIWVFLIILVIIPTTFNFFLTFQKLIKFSFLLSFEVKLNEFFNFYIVFYLTLNKSFQTFFFLLLCIVYYNNSNKRSLWKFWKILYFYFIICAVFLILDFFSQIIFSFIFIVLYEFLLFGLLIKINLNLLIYY